MIHRYSVGLLYMWKVLRRKILHLHNLKCNVWILVPYSLSNVMFYTSYFLFNNISCENFYCFHKPQTVHVYSVSNCMMVEFLSKSNTLLAWILCHINEVGLYNNGSFIWETVVSNNNSQGVRLEMFQCINILKHLCKRIL